MKSFNFLINDKNIFTKNSISQIGSHFGFYRNYILERHLWIYELMCQFQDKCGENCVLKGGACTQLYLPLEFQRCTSDIDFLTTLNKEDINLIMSNIKNDFDKEGINIKYYEYKPKNAKDLPMITYVVEVPFHFKPNKRKSLFNIKFDFLFVDSINKLNVTSIPNAKTFGMDIQHSPLCINPSLLISDKLSTFAINSIGIDIFKLDGFYKNIYDLYYLLNTFNDKETFYKVSINIYESIDLELSIKKLPKINVNKILNDILKTLLYFSIVDLNYQKRHTPKKLKHFQKYYLQSSINNKLNLDTWSIMSMYLYLWTDALKKYINNRSCTGISKLKSLKYDCDNFSSLTSKQKKKYIKKLRLDIKRKNKILNLSSISDPLRIIYTYYIMCK